MGEERSTTKEGPLHDRSDLTSQLITTINDGKMVTLPHECIHNTFSNVLKCDKRIP